MRRLREAKLMFKGVNWIAVAVAFVLVYGAGFLWYGVLFTRAWTAALGREPDMSNPGLSMTLGALNTLLTVVGIAWLLARIGADTLMSGIAASVAAFVFFVLTASAMDYIYQGDSEQLFAIDIGYQLVTFLIAGAVLGVMRRRETAAATA
jgi:nitrate reductase gamma subunit